MINNCFWVVGLIIWNDSPLELRSLLKNLRGWMCALQCSAI